MGEGLSGQLLKFAEEQASLRMAGEIVLSESHEASLRKWRELFGLTQKEVAKLMGVSSSVVSDYEKGKRRYPGSRFIKRYVQSLVEMDSRRGGKHVLELVKLESSPPGSIIAMREFRAPVRISTILQATKSELLAAGEKAEGLTFGYTALDSIKAILSFTGVEMMKIFGRTTNRALIFTNVTHGRSPMVAVRLYPFKPSAVIIHGPKELDPIAVEIARLEEIPTALCRLPSVSDLTNALKDIELLEAVRESRKSGE